MSLGVMIVAIIGGTAGILSTFYLLISLPAVILWKLYRTAVHKISMTK